MDKPRMQLEGMDGNIFGILGAAMRKLRHCAQYDQANEMSQRVKNSDSYEEALSIISEYVITELSEDYEQEEEFA